MPVWSVITARARFLVISLLFLCKQLWWLYITCPYACLMFLFLCPTKPNKGQAEQPEWVRAVQRTVIESWAFYVPICRRPTTPLCRVHFQWSRATAWCVGLPSAIPKSISQQRTLTSPSVHDPYFQKSYCVLCLHSHSVYLICRPYAYHCHSRLLENQVVWQSRL